MTDLPDQLEAAHRQIASLIAELDEVCRRNVRLQLECEVYQQAADDLQRQLDAERGKQK